jgi:thymidylate synthase (FAD)
MSITPTTTTTPPSTSDSPKLGSLLPDRAQVLDRGFVYLIDEPNSDVKVVNAARISFAKKSTAGKVWAGNHYEYLPTPGDIKLIEYLAAHNHWTPFAHCRALVQAHLSSEALCAMMDIGGYAVRPADGAYLISLSLAHKQFSGGFPNCQVSKRALGDESRWTPCFTMSWDAWPEEQPVTLHIKMPVFVARQWMKSNHGIVYNEISRRYVDDAPDIHVPDKWRKRPEKSIKQGSSDEEVVDTLGIREVPAHYHFAETCYNHLLQDEVAPEQARIVLPVAHYTEVWMTCSLRALARVLKLRLDSHAQWEIQQYAKAVRAVVEPRYPTLTKLMKEFDDEREDAGTTQPQGDGGVPVKADGGQVQREQGGGD